MDQVLAHAIMRSVEDSTGIIMDLENSNKSLSTTLINTTDSWQHNFTSGLHNSSFYNDTDGNDSFLENDNRTLDVLKGYPYPSMYSWVHIILSSIVVTIIMLIIVLGNILVMVAVAVDRNLKGLQNWFITSLAVSDLFVGLFIMPLSLANELMGYWHFGNIMCELWLAVDVLLCTASILNLCLISLDRYWSVTRAVSYVKTRTRKRAIIYIIIVWALSMIICLPPLVGWKRPQPTKFGYPLCVLSEEPGYVAYSTMGSFYIPLIVMVLVYFKIYLAARSRARRYLKKKPIKTSPPENGKSSSTTTSFSNPVLKVGGGPRKLSPTREYSSDDDRSASVSGQHSSHSKGSREGGHQDNEHQNDVDKVNISDELPVDNNSPKRIYTDEKLKLLSGQETGETDSTSEVFNKGKHSDERHIHFSEDTDSQSDVNTATSILPDKRGYRNNAHKEENLQPLLEGSDSQRESDRNSNSLQKDKHDPNVTDTTGDEAVYQGPDTIKLQKHNHNQEDKHLLKAPSQHQHHTGSPIRNISSSLARKIKEPVKKEKPIKEDPEKFKRKVARAKERRATIVLGIIMATFIGCWLPFFSIYLITSFAGLYFPPMAFAVIFWLGYCNSALNPIIYTIFNRDFRQAFQRIIFGRRNTF